jgi:hypothetical protein
VMLAELLEDVLAKIRVHGEECDSHYRVHSIGAV